jgi:hypothetical protein
MEQQPRIVSVYEDEETKQRKERRKRWAFEQAHRTRAGLLTSVLLARLSINLALRGETNKRVRKVREGLLLSRFSRFAGDLTRLSFGGRRP